MTPTISSRFPNANQDTLAALYEASYVLSEGWAAPTPETPDTVRAYLTELTEDNLYDPERVDWNTVCDYITTHPNYSCPHFTLIYPHRSIPSHHTPRLN